MSYDWVRLWKDMPNDPKWLVVRHRASHCVTDITVGHVISVFVQMMTNADSHGDLVNWCDEDIAVRLEYKPEQVTAIREAMQGKVLEGNHLKGWEKRQPKREDSSAFRMRASRARSDAARRNVTQRDAPEEKREERKSPDPNGSGANAPLKIDDDPKELLFSEGLRWLRSLKPEDSDRTARGLLGKMLRDCGGDAHAGKLWGIICDARRERKADPVAWVCAVIDANRPRAGPAKPNIQNPAMLSYLKHPVIFDDEPSPQDRRKIIDH